jgi:D-sedoheptulose 7-phosphate isomerase
MNLVFHRWRAGGSAADDHLAALQDALSDFDELPRLHRWGLHLAEVLGTGGRLLAAGNGGSAAHAQHLTSELVGRYRDERRPLSAICLCAESSSVTAISNDYGADALFARQVYAHGREGDVLVALSTSGGSPNVLEAVQAAQATGMLTWALTGRAPNPLAELADDAVCVDTPRTATVQEVHQVAIHLVCEALDSVLADCNHPATAELAG